MLTQDVLEHASSEIYRSVRVESVWLRLAGDCLALLACATSVPSCFCVAGAFFASRTMSIRLWAPPSRMTDAMLVRTCVMTMAVELVQAMLCAIVVLLSYWVLSVPSYAESARQAWRWCQMVCGVIGGCCFVSCVSMALLLLVMTLEVRLARLKIHQRYLGGVHLLHHGGYPLQAAHDLSLRTIRGLSPVQALVDTPIELQPQPTVGQPVVERPVLGRAVGQQRPAQETLGVPVQSPQRRPRATYEPRAVLPPGLPPLTTMASTLERLEYWKNQYLWWSRTDHATTTAATSTASGATTASVPPLSVSGSAMFRCHSTRVSPRDTDGVSDTYNI